MPLRLRRMLPRRYVKDPQCNQSLSHSVRDGVAYSLMSGAGETYFTAFALFLKATPTQVGLLAALPQLMASVAQLFSAFLGRLTLHRKRIILWGAGIQAFSWIPIICIAILVPEMSIYWFIGGVIIYFFGYNLAIPQWCSLMGDLVPERKRGRFFAVRTRIASVTAFAALVAAGLILHFFERQGMALVGFVSIFAIAVVGRFISIYHLTRMHDPPGHVAALEMPLSKNFWRYFIHSPVARFSLFVACLQFATYIASPFFAVYMLNDLKYSYFEYTLNIAAVILAQSLTLYGWGRIGDAFGNRVILVITGIIIPVLPLLWLISSHFWFILLLQTLGGVFWAGFNLSASNYVYDLVPRDKRVTLLAVHNSLSNLGVFLGALAGGVLAVSLPQTISINALDWHWHWLTPIYGLFLISAVLRLVMVGLFLPGLPEVRKNKSIKLKDLLRRVIGGHNARSLLLAWLPLLIKKRI